MSTRFKYNKEEIDAVLSATAWSLSAGVITALISIVGLIEFPPEYAFIPAVINIVLFAGLKFVQGKRG